MNPLPQCLIATQYVVYLVWLAQFPETFLSLLCIRLRIVYFGCLLLWNLTRLGVFLLPVLSEVQLTTASPATTRY